MYNDCFPKGSRLSCPGIKCQSREATSQLLQTSMRLCFGGIRGQRNRLSRYTVRNEVNQVNGHQTTLPSVTAERPDREENRTEVGGKTARRIRQAFLGSDYPGKDKTEYGRTASGNKTSGPATAGSADGAAADSEYVSGLSGTDSVFRPELCRTDLRICSSGNSEQYRLSLTKHVGPCMGNSSYNHSPPTKL